MKHWILVSFMFSSGAAYGTGGVECAGKDANGSPVTLRWGVGHVEGSSRISPYTLKSGTEELPVSDLKEVGYWFSDGKIYVRLADSQVMQTSLLLMVEETKDGTFLGTLTVTKPVTAVPLKVKVRCGEA